MKNNRLVYMNGKFLPESEAKVSIFDSALMFGDMVFEMTRSFNKNQFKLREHLERLYTGIKILQIPLTMTIDEMEKAVYETIEKNEAAFSDDDERPESTYGGTFDPDLGCIDCEGNDYNQNSRPNGLVSCWGAIGNLTWIEEDNNIPTIMFHGTLDPIVPFNSGFPFTIDIALPFVYGSNLIHQRLNEVGIENELYVGEGELHEYWGTVNGNWFDGPNDNFYIIQDLAFNFLYNTFDIDIGDLNQDSFIDIIDIVILVNVVLGTETNDLSDINDDGLVNILDIIELVNIILS